jgi:hypothetical protein
VEVAIRMPSVLLHLSFDLKLSSVMSLIPLYGFYFVLKSTLQGVKIKRITLLPILFLLLIIMIVQPKVRNTLCTMDVF